MPKLKYIVQIIYNIPRGLLLEILGRVPDLRRKKFRRPGFLYHEHDEKAKGLSNIGHEL